MKTTVTLTPEDVEVLVREFLSDKFKTVGEVQVVMKSELRGNQRDYHYEPIFKGYTCEVEM